jgi:hypothetical protein
MRIEWDGDDFTPPSVKNLMAAINVSDVGDVSGTRVPEAKRKGWIGKCPDCDEVHTFYFGTPRNHDCLGL